MHQPCCIQSWDGTDQGGRVRGGQMGGDGGALGLPVDSPGPPLHCWGRAVWVGRSSSGHGYGGSLQLGPIGPVGQRVPCLWLRWRKAASWLTRVGRRRNDVGSVIAGMAGQMGVAGGAEGIQAEAPPGICNSVLDPNKCAEMAQVPGGHKCQEGTGLG